MIEDTNANYFVVEKAYKIYWEHHEMPELEMDEFSNEKEEEKFPSKRERRKIEQDNEMRVSIKKYWRWHEKMLPYVQEDGSILTPTERLLIWESQRK